ncbi:hypothetical protein JZX86_05665 [Agrobacterium rosae]|uniref:hypothetical protein n=1 Tax=Agrobacterium rosae TaxID=1972867 RepID=UPI0019D38EA9|nr:hypothetical protein [Agrobacterium rosae]MBN7804850.1 hypothetical protein [Agrobacterium rosae]
MKHTVTLELKEIEDAIIKYVKDVFPNAGAVTVSLMAHEVLGYMDQPLGTSFTATATYEAKP